MAITSPHHPTSAPVTVIVPVYNQAGFLSECLGSLRAQTVENWQAIIVDDASTIGDIDAVVQAEKDSRFEVVHHKRNRGLAASRNTGIRAAQTPWVLCLDADDKLPGHTLETLLLLARRRPGTHAFFGDIQTFGVTNNAMPQTAQTPSEFFIQRLMPGAGFLLRRDFWQSTGGYCENETLKIGQEDTDFWITAFEHGIEVQHIGKVTYLYHRHGGNMTSQIHPDYHKVRKFIYSRHRAFIDSQGMRRRFFANSYWRSATGRWMRGERRAATAFAFWSLLIGREQMDLDRVSQLIAWSNAPARRA